jgi:thymidylate synthase ThyX
MRKKKVQRRVYVLDGKREEDIAMAMAVTSRSPLPFDKILSQIDEKKSSNFLEKFYITYGHGSIADTAFIHIAIENISQLAIKALENTRLAAYQEKSTRYQIMDRQHSVEPKEIKKSKYHELYQKTINDLFDVYEEFVKKLLEQARKENPKKLNESEGAYENRIRIPVIDRCRLILPAAVMGNVGVTMSGRSIEYTIVKLLSSPLSEAKELGREIGKVAKKKLPILVKFTDPIEYLQKQEKKLSKLADKTLFKKEKFNNKRVDLVQYDKNALDRVLAASFERFSVKSYKTILENLKKMSQRKKEQIFDEIIGKRKMRHDKPLRELENTYYTFDIVCDFGAYRDLQRHRMLTQTAQLLTTFLGYEEPIDLEKTGLSDLYRQAMKKADEAYQKIAKQYPLEAQYLVPMAYKRRFLFNLNLRELFYLIELRSRPQGHISYRRVVWDMWKAVNKVHPYFAKHIKVDFRGE